jgi:hypothetical protein
VPWNFQNVAVSSVHLKWFLHQISFHVIVSILRYSVQCYIKSQITNNQVRTRLFDSFVGAKYALLGPSTRVRAKVISNLSCVKNIYHYESHIGDIPLSVHDVRHIYEIH